MTKPIILMTPDLDEEFSDGGEPTYHVRANYAEAIAAAGGLPLIAPYAARASELLALADGILITGSRPGVQVVPVRHTFEQDLITHALELGKPVLGICHGMQLIGEVLGGVTLRDLPAVTVDHMPRAVPDVLAHDLILKPCRLLAQSSEFQGIAVNSLHRHVLSGPGRFQVIAEAPDGAIEAFEGETTGFCLGVQWHPEYGLTALDTRIFQTFIAACSNEL